jgi:dTDP-glucose 4,6-dehydratase/UDP-glucose 4-epimerase
MKILVLGSHGFIGSHLVASFISKGYTVSGCDLVEDRAVGYAYQKLSILSPDFDTLFSSNQFDVCVNASGSGNVSYSLNHPISDFEANTLSVAKVLDTIRKYRPSCKYIHISSAAVYGNPKGLPIKESDTLAPLSPYGYHKLMSEQLCKEYYHLYNLPVTIIRPFSVYGNGLKKQLLWDICTKLKNADTISLYGTGNESRDFIHINEVIALINIIINKASFTGDIYNAATGKETSIRQIAEIFEKYFGSDKKINFSSEVKEGDPINWRAAIANAETLGFTPMANIEASIVEYIRWFTNLADV